MIGDGKDIELAGLGVPSSGEAATECCSGNAPGASGKDRELAMDAGDSATTGAASCFCDEDAKRRFWRGAILTGPRTGGAGRCGDEEEPSLTTKMIIITATTVRRPSRPHVLIAPFLVGSICIGKLGVL